MLILKLIIQLTENLLVKSKGIEGFGSRKLTNAQYYFRIFVHKHRF